MTTIKGYLPVRVKLQSFTDEEEYDETFFYVKEHQQKEQATTGASKNETLFVSNAPVIPGIQTRVLLKALLGRFADVRRVTVIQSPVIAATGNLDEAAAEQLLSWTSRYPSPTFLAPSLAEGSFAHVVFTSSKEMKRAMKNLQQVMLDNDDSKGQGLAGISLDKIELQTLRDASERTSDADNDDDELLLLDQDKESSLVKSDTKSGFTAVVERYQSQCRQLSRAMLLEECNVVMESFEDAEQQARNALAATNNTPDEDGFVTVSYTAQVGAQQELEQDVNAGTAGAERRRKGQKRNRKKKQGAGASELQDFYRFQTKVNRKRTVQELRERFEEDLVKLKKMKDEKQFRPF